MTFKQITYEDLSISPADVYRQMGYRDTTPDTSTQRETLAVIDMVRPWLKPRFCYFITRTLPSFHMGATILRQLRGSEAYACFIATAGTEFEAWQQRLKADADMVRVFIADALGSVIAERCADAMERHVQGSIDKLSWHHTNRFSPGYCGWHVSEQQLLFATFANAPSTNEADSNTCGVHLNDSSLMIPIKSVSGIMGLGKEVRHEDYPCAFCGLKNCFRR